MVESAKMFNEAYLNLPLLRNFTMDELERLLTYSRQATYDAEKTIFRQGDPGRELYIILSGKVRFEYHHTDTGEDTVLSWAGYGMLFGEIAFLLPQPRTATAIAEEKTELLMFEKVDIQKLIDLYPSLAVTFYHAMALELAARLRSANPRIL